MCPCASKHLQIRPLRCHAYPVPSEQANMFCTPIILELLEYWLRMRYLGATVFRSQDNRTEPLPAWSLRCGICPLSFVFKASQLSTIVSIFTLPFWQLRFKNVSVQPVEMNCVHPMTCKSATRLSHASSPASSHRLCNDIDNNVARTEGHIHQMSVQVTEAFIGSTVLTIPAVWNVVDSPIRTLRNSTACRGNYQSYCGILIVFWQIFWRVLSIQHCVLLFVSEL